MVGVLHVNCNDWHIMLEKVTCVVFVVDMHVIYCHDESFYTRSVYQTVFSIIYLLVQQSILDILNIGLLSPNIILVEKY